MNKIDMFYQALRDYDFINPKFTFDGDYTFQQLDNMDYDINHDILYLNSIVDQNGNRYENLLNKYYYSHFNMDTFSNVAKRYGFPLLVNGLREDGKGRELYYSYMPFLFNIAESKDIVKELLNEPIKLIEEIRDWFKEQRKELSDFKRNRLISEFCYNVALRFDSQRRGKLTEDEVKSICRGISDSSIDKTINAITNTIINLKFLKQDIEKGMQPIDNYEFVNCFDRDKFYLMYMKAIIDNQESSIANIGKPDNSFIEVTQYLYFIEFFDLKNYNTVISVYDKKKDKIIRYTINDLIEEYNAIYERFKDTLKRREISTEQIDKLNISHDITGCEKLREVLSGEDAETIETNWEVLPSGTKEIVDTRPSIYRPRRKSDKSQRVTEDDILYRKYVLQNTNFILRLVGKDKFSGYFGYMYPNGLVVFEIFYDKNGSIVQSGATYIMNYKNFVEFSKLTKTEIMDYIKNTDNPDVRRIYHKGRWADNLNVALNKVEQTEEVAMEVETLVDQIKSRKKVESDY